MYVGYFGEILKSLSLSQPVFSRIHFSHQFMSGSLSKSLLYTYTDFLDKSSSVLTPKLLTLLLYVSKTSILVLIDNM